MKYPAIISFLIFLLHSSSIDAQVNISGRVIDDYTKEPLAFVTIIVNDTQEGFLTDIDGVFNVRTKQDVSFLKFSYVGYERVIYPVDTSKDFHSIKMQRSVLELDEVVIFPGENPAHRIISNVMHNRRANNPENRRSFSYSSYNKFILTSDKDYFTKRFFETGDSAFIRITDVLDKRHLFISESVTNNRFRYPNRRTEEVIANRVAGLKNPVFSMLASQLQSFSFYDDFIRILDIEYVSPLAPGSLSRYLFELQDTLYSGADSIYVISYRPFRNANFDGMEGVLYINSDKWAVQNVIARPVSFADETIEFSIQQKYVLVDDKQWFPVQLNTDLTVRINPEGLDGSFPIYGQSRSYISDIVLDPPLKRRDFSAFDVDYAPDANERGEEFLQKYRIEQLSEKEISTYKVVDSIGEAANFEGRLRRLETLLFGSVKIGFVDLSLDKFYSYNVYERHRLGVGLYTNDDFVRWFRIGGYYAYGTGDREHKYKIHPELILSSSRGLKLGYEHEHNVFERGGTDFLSKTYWFENIDPRAYYIRTMDVVSQNRVYIESRFFRNSLTVQSYATQKAFSWIDDYRYSELSSDIENGVSSFNLFEVGIKTRLGIGEQYIRTPGRIYRDFSSRPALFFNVSKGIENISYGDFDYLKLQARFDYLFSIPFYGKQRWRFEAGWVDTPSLPLPLLFAAPGSKPETSLVGYTSPQSFGAMKVDEFASNVYAYLFFEHNFGSLLLRLENYAPEFSIVSNIGWSRLDSYDQHLNTPVSPMDKGYFESGIRIYKVLPNRWLKAINLNPFLNPGIEILYRFGPHSLDSNFDNFAFNIAFGIV